MKSLAIVISLITTYTPLGSPTKNYVASVQEMPYDDCLVLKKNTNSHNETVCVKLNDRKK